MDKFKFAQFISYLTMRFERSFDIMEMETIDHMITEGMPKQEPMKAGVELVDELLLQMKAGMLIQSIKAYRALTGAGLKESKDAVEKYRGQQPKTYFPMLIEYATGAKAIVKTPNDITPNAPFVILETDYQ